MGMGSVRGFIHPHGNRASDWCEMARESDGRFDPILRFPAGGNESRIQNGIRGLRRIGRGSRYRRGNPSFPGFGAVKEETSRSHGTS